MMISSFCTTFSTRAGWSAVLTALAASGCGSSRDGDGEDGGAADASPRVDGGASEIDGGSADDDSGPIEPVVWFVDAVDGDDANEGTRPDIAFRTITRALRAPGSGDIVQVAPGLYDAALGETFPIAVPEGVTLRGDEASKGADVVVAGNSPSGDVGSAITPGPGSTLAGLSIRGVPSGATVVLGVYVDAWDVTVTNCTLTGSRDAAISAIVTSKSVIRGNLIARNGVSGIVFNDTVAVRVEGNVIRDNGAFGVVFEAGGSDADLGGGEMGSAGGNTIACNGLDDLRTELGAATIIAAAGNVWDHVPPSAADIMNRHGSTIDLTGATLAADPCP